MNAATNNLFDCLASICRWKLTKRSILYLRNYFHLWLPLRWVIFAFMLLFQTPVDSAYSICVKFLHRSKAVNQQRQRHHRFFLKHTSELKNKLRLSLRNPFVCFVQLCSLSEQSAPIKCYSPHSAVNLCKWFFFFFLKSLQTFSTNTF